MLSLQLTVYSALMQVNSGRMEAYLQYCPDPCAPWWHFVQFVADTCSQWRQSKFILRANDEGSKGPQVRHEALVCWGGLGRVCPPQFGVRAMPLENFWKSVHLMAFLESFQSFV